MTVTGDILGTGTSGLLAFQRSLATIGNNITNVNTEGYSRQRVELVSRTPQPAGNGFIGTGVQALSVTRVYDEFLNSQLTSAISADSRLSYYARFAGQVDNLLADPQTGMAPALQSFFNALQDVANDPGSIPARQVLLSEGDSLAATFHTLDQRLDGLDQGINQQLGTLTGEINSLAQSIASLNNEISRLSGIAGGQPPNDLLDQRDQMINQLAERISVSVQRQDDGSINVFVGNGQTLVLGAKAGTLSTVPSQSDSQQMDLALSFGTTSVVVSNSLSGGSIGGLLDFRNQVLSPARNELGRVATVIAESFNAQHNAGMDLDGLLGGDFFSVPAPSVGAYANNTGTDTVTATVTDIGALTSADYVLSYDGSNYQLTNQTTKVTQTLGAGGPFNVDGLTINTAGLANAGDRFLIRPTRGASAGIDTLITDPRKVAAAAPIRSAATAGNTGNATISAGTVLDASDANLLNSVTINFTGPGTYQVNGAGPLIAYTPGANIDINGWRVQINGTPAAGDSFSVQQNSGGAGDNRNAQLLSGLQSKGILDNGTTSYLDAYGQMVASVGTKTHAADVAAKAQASVLVQARNSREAVSGVNLDEEAANMIRFQQAYQAAAQVIAVAGSLFQTLLGAIGR